MRKAFTLVEMSIVLVIIGVLFSMVTKGKQLINTAKVRAEISVIRNGNMALSTYLMQQPKPPVIKNKSNTFIDFKAFLKAMNMNESDFLTKIGDRNGEDYYYLPIIMSDTENNGFGYASKGGSKLYGLYTAADPLTYESFFPYLETYCKIEQIIDDRNILTGQMRYYVADASKYPLDYSNCSEYENDWEDYAIAAEI